MKIFTAALLCGTIMGAQAQSQLLWSDTISVNGLVGVPAEGVHIIFGPELSGFDFNLLFSSRAYNDADAGQTYVATSDADDPEWTKVVGDLTDGIDEQVIFGFLQGGYKIALESDRFAGTGPGPDLNGYDITAISLKINNLSIVRDTPYVNGASLEGSATVSIYVAPVPEPGTWSLLCLGLPCSVVLSRWRRHNHSSRFPSARRQRIVG